MTVSLPKILETTLPINEITSDFVFVDISGSHLSFPFSHVLSHTPPLPISLGTLKIDDTFFAGYAW